MAGRRVERLNEQLKREITEILRREVKDPRVGLVVITGVDAAPDLTFARIHLQITGDGDEAKTLEGLRAAAPFIRGQIGRRLRVRRAPELDFQVDHSLEHVSRIERLLAEARGGDDEPDPA